MPNDPETSREDALNSFRAIYDKYGDVESINLMLSLYPRILDDLGHFLSCVKKSSLFGNGEPQPWYTYAAIDYLRGLNLSSRRVFEFGSGMSSLFYAARCASVTSVEDNEEWAGIVEAQKPDNLSIKRRVDADAYVGAIGEDGVRYDIIVVDGLVRRRCAVAALEHVAADGLIILDNSDCHVGAGDVLREAGLLQVDMTDFSPGNWFRHCTSFFFQRSFRAEPIERHQPRKTLGMQKNISYD